MHVNEIQNRYGFVLFLNLLATEKEEEERLTSLLLQALQTRHDNNARVVQYDYHRNTQNNSDFTAPDEFFRSGEIHKELTQKHGLFITSKQNPKGYK